MPTTEKKPGSVKYLATIRLSEKGQMVLPKEYRTEQGLEAGSPIAILKIGSGLLLLPEINKFNSLCEKIESSLKNAGVSEKQLLKTLPATRQEVFRELYPELGDEESL